MDPKSTQDRPYVMDVDAGNYAWCACGQSSNQPYCDGSHAGTGLAPKVVKIDEPRRVAWCGCRKSGDQPFCDGSHAR